MLGTHQIVTTVLLSYIGQIHVYHCTEEIIDNVLNNTYITILITFCHLKEQTHFFFLSFGGGGGDAMIACDRPAGIQKPCNSTLSSQTFPKFCILDLNFNNYFYTALENSNTTVVIYWY